jgi:hypothetical protein
MVNKFNLFLCMHLYSMNIPVKSCLTRAYRFLYDPAIIRRTGNLKNEKTYDKQKLFLVLVA